MKHLLGLLVLAALFAYFIWPTRYEEFAAGEGPYTERTDLPTRVDRFNGEVWVKKASGDWSKLPDPPRPPKINPVTRPYKSVDPSVVQQQKQQIEMTQQAADAVTQQKK